jgi:hypothetical protein
MMDTFKSIKKTLKDHKVILKKKYKVKEIGIFGSYVRGEQKKRKSDLDILVEFDDGIGLFRFIEMENYLTDLLGIKVDLVMKSSLKPQIGRQILKEVVYL